MLDSSLSAGSSFPFLLLATAELRLLPALPVECQPIALSFLAELAGFARLLLQRALPAIQSKVLIHRPHCGRYVGPQFIHHFIRSIRSFSIRSFSKFEFI